MQIPKDLTRDLKNRLKSLQGQIGGIIKLLDMDESPDKILFQFKAVDKGLQKAHYLLLDDVYRKALAIKIVDVVEACPGNCGNEDRIEFIKQQFPHYKLDELSKQMKEIQEIEARLARYNSENTSEEKKL